MKKNNYQTKLHARHGDVFIFKVEGNVENANVEKRSNVILALGEVTGHSHKVSVDTDGAVMVDEKCLNDGIYFELKEKGTLTHQEHETIVLEPGKYISIVQREYDAIEHTRKVLD